MQILGCGYSWFPQKEAVAQLDLTNPPPLERLSRNSIMFVIPAKAGMTEVSFKFCDILKGEELITSTHNRTRTQ